MHPQMAAIPRRSDNGGEALASPFSHQSVPLTAHNLPLRLPEWNIYLRKRAAEVYLMKLHALAHNCSDSWYTRVAGAGNERNMRKGNDNEAYLAGHRQRGEPTLACASAPARLACSAARISMSDRCQCHCLRRRGTARGKGEVEGRAEGA